MDGDHDVKDIFKMERDAGGGCSTPQLSKEAIMGTGKEPKKLKKTEPLMKRPAGMNREVYALLYSDNKDRDTTPLIPTDTGSGYRQPKARLGRKHVRPWKWMPFSNPAREDGLILCHWRRAADEGKEYPFSRFNKHLDVPSYTDEEYTKHLVEESWTREETDHLFELCKRFDLRFVIVQDRFDAEKYQKRSMEELKERYYSVCNRLVKARNPLCSESQLVAYDGPHETRRKMQLEQLLNRTKEQVMEEEMLIAELKKIELRKKEREKKQQDLQKLISAAEQNAESHKASVKKTPMSSVKKMKITGTPSHTKAEGSVVFKSYDKSGGVSLRSSKMKIPMTLGQRKAKAIEQLLEELGVGMRPMPTEKVCVQFNELRNDILLLLDLKSACDACEFELQSLRHRYKNLPPAKQSQILFPVLAPTTPKKIIDVVSSATAGRKRRLATLDSVVKKSRKN